MKWPGWESRLEEKMYKKSDNRVASDIDDKDMSLMNGGAGRRDCTRKKEKRKWKSNFQGKAVIKK